MQHGRIEGSSGKEGQPPVLVFVIATLVDLQGTDELNTYFPDSIRNPARQNSRSIVSRSSKRTWWVY